MYKLKDTHKSKVKCGFPISKHYKTTIIKIVWYWNKDRHKNQWKRIEARNKPPSIWAIDFSQEVPDHSMRKRQSFQQMILERLNIHM